MPYVIIAYDVEVERIDRVRAILRQYLFWVQNSLFEGQISETSLQSLITRVTAVIDRDHDSVIIYKMNSPKGVKRSVIGVDKGQMEYVV